MDLTTLDESRFPGMAGHCRVQRFATVQNVKPRCRKVQPAFHQFAQQSAHHGRVLRRSLADAQHGLGPIAANAKGYDDLPVFEWSPVKWSADIFEFMRFLSNPAQSR